jgi:hypothetical protein
MQRWQTTGGWGKGYYVSVPPGAEVDRSREELDFQKRDSARDTRVKVNSKG